MRTRTAVAVVAVLCLTGAASAGSPASADNRKVVLFVCEHGAAKSVVAAAHFNERARERKLPYRAVAKGTDPQAEPSTAAVKGLTGDGLQALPRRPEAVTAADVAGASRVVTFGCDISKVAPNARPESWNDIPDLGEGYPRFRGAIMRHIDELIAELEAPQ
jgi:arsenate reductase